MSRAATISRTTYGTTRHPVSAGPIRTTSRRTSRPSMSFSALRAPRAVPDGAAIPIRLSAQAWCLASEECSRAQGRLRPTSPQEYLVSDAVSETVDETPSGQIGCIGPTADGGDAQVRCGMSPVDIFTEDRKSVGSGKSVSVLVDLGGGRIIKKKKKHILS